MSALCHQFLFVFVITCFCDEPVFSNNALHCLCGKEFLEIWHCLSTTWNIFNAKISVVYIETAISKHEE